MRSQGCQWRASISFTVVLIIHVLARGLLSLHAKLLSSALTKLPMAQAVPPSRRRWSGTRRSYSRDVLPPHTQVLT